ncbi:MAG TPA: Trm112 family protein [Thermoplasmatales archaeon]|nr:Trm112 family protein [Thermoplasmatales archaeon]
MHQRFLDLLRCPICHGTLELGDAVREDEEIVSGTLACAACGAAYPIREGIPYLLVEE